MALVYVLKSVGYFHPWDKHTIKFLVSLMGCVCLGTPLILLLCLGHITTWTFLVKEVCPVGKSASVSLTLVWFSPILTFCFCLHSPPVSTPLDVLPGPTVYLVLSAQHLPLCLESAWWFSFHFVKMNLALLVLLSYLLDSWLTLNP